MNFLRLSVTKRRTLSPFFFFSSSSSTLLSTSQVRLIVTKSLNRVRVRGCAFQTGRLRAAAHRGRAHGGCAHGFVPSRLCHRPRHRHCCHGVASGRKRTQLRTPWNPLWRKCGQGLQSRASSRSTCHALGLLKLPFQLIYLEEEVCSESYTREAPRMMRSFLEFHSSSKEPTHNKPGQLPCLCSYRFQMPFHAHVDVEVGLASAAHLIGPRQARQKGTVHQRKGAQLQL